MIYRFVQCMPSLAESQQLNVFYRGGGGGGNHMAWVAQCLQTFGPIALSYYSVAIKPVNLRAVGVGETQTNINVVRDQSAQMDDGGRGKKPRPQKCHRYCVLI